MRQVSHTSSRAASLRLARAVSHLQRARQQLSAATHAAPNPYHQEQIRRLAADLRTLSQPIAGIASSLERGGRQ
jgi:HAMP domain-containing protein